MKKKLLFLLTFFSLSCFAQFSKTHYIPPLISAEGLIEDQYLYISTPSLTDVKFKIIANGGNVVSGTVNSSKPFRYSIGTGDNTQLFTPTTKTGIITNKGYVIEAEDLIYVSARVNAGKNDTGGYNHAGGLVSKGNSALGTTFRLGAMLNPNVDPTVLNFASILPTENETKITISNLQNGTRLLNGTTVYAPITITLKKNESYVLALENYNDGSTASNSSKIIGALVTSDKPIVVNSGSFGGSNGTAMIKNPKDGSLSPAGRDVGFDQIVALEKTGKEYVFVKGLGTDELERVLLVAHSDNTQIFINGNSTPYSTINSGNYVAIDGSQFINGNLYVTTSENVFAYQCIGGLAPGFLPDGTSNNPDANQNLFFVPPINCSTPNTVDNIPQIQSIGNNTFNGFLNIVTETGASVLLNNSPITASPIAIEGTSAFVRYTVANLSGNIAVKSTKQVYVSYFGTNGAATYGGYYSGFDLKPEIVSELKIGAITNCIGDVNLKINTLSSYDAFQWYRDNIEITGETNNHYLPTAPGFYKVRGSISACGTTIFSDNIPVSECPINVDNDLANDNIDIDYDNDGLSNCAESFGSKNIDLSNSNSGTVTAGTYSNSFSGSIVNTLPAAPTPFAGYADGSFVTEVASGKGTSVSYNLNFANPINLSLEYPMTANPANLLNSDSEYIVNSDIDKTITVLNPDNQLLIDTNYDGVYESGVTQFSSFEIRFRLNGYIPLPAGTGTFKFQSYQTKSFKITHQNLSDTAANKSTFKLVATCIPKDSDGDGVPDQIDLDSDNDGIPDLIESQTKPKALSNTDSNQNGLDDMFEPIANPLDTDNDGVPNYLDLDSDNDGIYDLVESGSNTPDSNKNGITDSTNFGTNGLADSLEKTNPDSGILNYTVSDTDGDGIKNATELDSDNDGCNDVIEAGFTDPNFDGFLGNIPIAVNSKGKVTGTIDGYTLPDPKYITATPILISKQPENQGICELQSGIISIDSNADSLQWQLSTDGVNWNNIPNNASYSNTTTNTLTLKNVSTAMNGYQYRVLLSRVNNDCGSIPSNAVKLTTLALPVVNSPITIVQCDDDTDGISNFNITEKNSFISTNSANETFTYYTTSAGANTKDSSTLIPNPLAYTSITNTIIWARVENANGCFSVAQLKLIVSTTQINGANFPIHFKVCDDFTDATHDDKDGITAFDFSRVKTDIEAMLPPPSTNYSIKFYPNEADALAETNAIANPSSYRNTTPNQQDIWVRVDSNLDNACFGLGAYIKLEVNPKPNIDLNGDQSADRMVCTNLPAFFVKLDAGILGNTPAGAYHYIWSKDGSVIPDETFDTLKVNEEGKYTVEVSTPDDNSCSRTRTITVTASDIAHLDSVSISDLSENNTVAANVSGTGNYDYSINAPEGPFQESNFFENIPAGIHELYVHDKNGCGTASKTIAVLGIPKFFTPNSDNQNDNWAIKGANAIFNSGAQIFIYDRYGKVIKQILPSSNGWDGTYTGNPMPADDYWYSIKLEDGREVKGHFSLQR